MGKQRQEYAKNKYIEDLFDICLSIQKKKRYNK